MNQRLKPLIVEATSKLYAKDLTLKVHDGIGYNSGQSNSRDRKVVRTLLELQMEFGETVVERN